MKIAIEKDVKWNQHSQNVSTDYYIRVDGTYVAVVDSEEKAREMVQKIKDTYVTPSKETIYEEEI